MGRLLLGAVVGLGVTLAFLILLTAASPETIDGMALTWVIFTAVGFNGLSFLARWLLTKNRRRTFLEGRFPFAVGLAKLTGLVACATLIVALLAGLIAGQPLSKMALSAFVFGLVAFAIVSLFANGILNVILLVRHLRGTLAATSREA